jgi:hypothetical protein
MAWRQPARRWQTNENIALAETAEINGRRRHQSVKSASTAINQHLWRVAAAWQNSKLSGDNELARLRKTEHY